MKKIDLRLKEEDKSFLENYIRSRKKGAMSIKRATLLLLLDEKKSNATIKDILKVGDTFILKIKNRYNSKGLEYAIYDKPRSGQPRKYKEKEEAELIALACSEAPEGRTRWTLELLMKEMKKKEGCETMNRESVRLILKKTNVNLG